MKGSFLLLLAVTSGLSSGCVTPERSRETANAATPPGTIAAQVCSNCHGLDGKATSPNFPNLAAQQEVYVVAQLTAFRNQGRSDPAGFEYMWGISKHLTDDQIKGLAAYYAKQKPPVLPSGDTSLASSGKEIFEHGVAGKNIPACASCHGDHGQGNDQFPRLAGQHSDYVQKQLMVFQRTDQRPGGAIMKPIAHDLTPTDIKAVAAYVQGILPQ
jgi:cytochrome c553